MIDALPERSAFVTGVGVALLNHLHDALLVHVKELFVVSLFIKDLRQFDATEGKSLEIGSENLQSVQERVLHGKGFFCFSLFAEGLATRHEIGQGGEHFAGDVSRVREAEQMDEVVLRRIVLHGLLVANIELLAVARYETKKSGFHDVCRVSGQGSLSFASIFRLLAASHDTANHVVVGRLFVVLQIKLFEVIAHVLTCGRFLIAVGINYFGKSIPLEVSNLIASIIVVLVPFILINHEPVTSFRDVENTMFITLLKIIIDRFFIGIFCVAQLNASFHVENFDLTIFGAP